MDTADVLALVISIIAILASLIGVLASYVHSTMSNQIALDANEISKRALDIALFSHQGNIFPVLEGWVRARAEDVNNVSIILSITNNSRGRAFIQKVSPFTRSDIKIHDRKGSPIAYPIELLYNNSVYFLVQGMTWHGQQLDAPNPSKDRLKEYYSQLYLTLARMLLIEVIYTDALGNRYRSILAYDNDKHKFVGNPQELKAE